MKKRLFLVLFLAAFMTINGKASVMEYESSNELYNPYNGGGFVINLNLKIMEVNPIKSSGGFHKSPPRIPTVYLSADTLYFAEGASFDEIQLVAKNEEVVYSSVVPYGEEMFCLPDYFVGVYELRLLRGDYCFYADIEL